MIGADPASLERLATSMGSSARRLDRIRANTRAQLHSVHWTGSDAEAIRRDWDGRYSHILASAALLLAAAETRLRHEAQQQIDASTAPVGGATSTSPAPGRRDSGLWGRDPMEWALLSLSISKIANAGIDAWERMDAARNLVQAQRILSSLGLAGMNAQQYMKFAGGKFGLTSAIGLAIGSAETYMAYRESGLNSVEVLDKGVGTLGSAGFGFAAGPLGGLAWSVGYDGSRALLKWSGGDKILEAKGANAYQSMHDAMFGKVPVAPEHTKEWIKSASPQERQAWLDQIARERAVAQAPIASTVWSAVKGIFR